MMKTGIMSVRSTERGKRMIDFKPYNEAVDNLVWTNYNLDLADFEEEIAYFCNMCLGMDEDEYNDLIEDELIAMMYDVNDRQLEDTKYDIKKDFGRPILVIGQLGLWNGTAYGYKEIPSGQLADCLYTEDDYSTFFVDDDEEFRCDGIHHDGTNHYMYRVWKKEVGQWEMEELKDKLYHGSATMEDIDKYTDRLGDIICNIYGWKCK